MYGAIDKQIAQWAAQIGTAMEPLFADRPDKRTVFMQQLRDATGEDARKALRKTVADYMNKPMASLSQEMFRLPKAVTATVIAPAVGNYEYGEFAAWLVSLGAPIDWKNPKKQKLAEAPAIMEHGVQHRLHFMVSGDGATVVVDNRLNLEWYEQKNSVWSKIHTQEYSTTLRSVAINNDGSTTIAATREDVRIITFRDGRFVNEAVLAREEFGVVAINGDGSVVAVGRRDGVTLYERNGKGVWVPGAPLLGHTDYLILSNDGSTLVTDSMYDNCRVYTKDGSAWRLQLQDKVKQVAMSRDGRVVVMGNGENVLLYALIDGRWQNIITWPYRDVASLAVNYDGSVVAIGERAGVVTLWTRASEGPELRQIAGVVVAPREYVRVSLDNAGTKLLTGSINGIDIYQFGVSIAAFLPTLGESMLLGRQLLHDFFEYGHLRKKPVPLSYDQYRLFKLLPAALQTKLAARYTIAHAAEHEERYRKERERFEQESMRPVGKSHAV